MNANEMGVMFGYGLCFICRTPFAFDPDNVPSVPIDPQTGNPPDVGPVEGGYERAVKQPLCRECVARINSHRITNGREPIFVPPNAYWDEP